ncbi:MAG: SurA N-terminal domain-containing protein [Candidatus Harrisonbacteria bacterium]|nr:SurA N-terminal domain-containing protein [Candidatus Harrisonbacteria bacterium]
MKDQLNKFVIGFLALIFVGLASYFVVRSGYYPVAIVNSQIIIARSLDREFIVAYQYYSRILAEQNGINVKSNNFKKELRRASLQDIIEKTLIRQELNKQIGGQLSVLIQERLNNSGDLSKIEEAAKLLYGLELAEFEKLILVPRAEREILENQFSSEGKILEEWLAETAKNASVILLTPEFNWNKGKLSSD